MSSILENTIFVFGSNLQGIHGAGAALHAARWCGARHGQAEGIMGVQNDDLLPASYAIPTKRTPHELLPLDEVKKHVEGFKDYARMCPRLIFQVTRIGCGLAGFTDDQIAPLFYDVPANCLLPGRWLAMKDPNIARVIVAGSRNITDRTLVFEKITKATSKLRLLSGFELVSGMARGPDTLAIEWAKSVGLGSKVARFPADWNRFSRAAGPIRNQQMAWYSTHLLAFWDGESVGTKGMINMAKKDGLMVNVIQV